MIREDDPTHQKKGTTILRNNHSYLNCSLTLFEYANNPEYVNYLRPNMCGGQAHPFLIR